MSNPRVDPTVHSESLRRIATDGYVEIPAAVPRALIDRVNALIELPLQVPTINGRRGYVKQGNTRFLHQTLTWGVEIIEIYTYPLFTELADLYASDEVHLSNYRIYRAYPSAFDRMSWHVDNKVDTYDPSSGRFLTTMAPDDCGLILILYLSDVEDGGLQIVSGSHTWARNQETWDDEAARFADQVVTFNNRPAGTAILYDYRCIHRAKPYSGGNTRTSLFAQYSPSRMPAGEPILLNARDIAALSDRQKRILNFGRSPTTENWPIGDAGEIAAEVSLPSLLKRYSVAGVKKVLNRIFANRRRSG